ncbi:GGDEF domain-containing protein [Virgibacillus flavescens]|uniref:GGDEF domain-containing protein n=1 Tax=Virgibacillus flavescens TaxID=1611422 RepID=UPI003D349E4C
MWLEDFLINACIILSIMYLSSLVHKKLIANVHENMKVSLFIGISVFIGWVSMLFGIHLNNFVIFDLRFVPIIIAVIFCKNYIHVLMIAFLIGMMRLTFGISEAAFVGMLNMMLLGAVGITLHRLLVNRSKLTKVLLIIITMNIINMVIIAIFGVIPIERFFLTIVPSVLPVNVIFSLLLVWIIKDLKDEFEHQMELRNIAETDPLTSLYNRRALTQYQTNLLNNPQSNNSPNAIAFIDIDHFKQVNDTYGHETGDKVLQHMGKKISILIGDFDFASRYGGEEFVIIFRDADEEKLIDKLEGFRKSLEAAPIYAGEHTITITVSIGVAVSPPLSLNKLIHYADMALYDAKRTGRNRICMYEESGSVHKQTAT